MNKAYSSFTRTMILALSSSAVSGYLVFLLQSNSNKQITPCSYLDPVSIDILALLIAAFLIVESLGAIIKHKQSLVRSQLTRCTRMCIGTCIMVIHIMQFIHK
jgi:hypothetical protein